MKKIELTKRNYNRLVAGTHNLAQVLRNQGLVLTSNNHQGRPRVIGTKKEYIDGRKFHTQNIVLEPTRIPSITMYTCTGILPDIPLVKARVVGPAGIAVPKHIMARAIAASQTGLK